MKHTESPLLRSRSEPSPSPAPMKRTEPTLICWHSERAGLEVLERALDALRNRRVRSAQVLYIVEMLVATLKRRRQVVAVPCGGLDSSLAESLLFGHRKGAFTGPAGDRPGLLAEADGGILILDEIQDLPKPAQRKLVRVFQDRERRFRPLGSDEEQSDVVELVCASNLHVADLREGTLRDLGIHRRGAGLRREDASPGCPAGRGQGTVAIGAPGRITFHEKDGHR